jgi:FkbM family methyltransferase
MSFISYAQNFEDVMLWRALKNVENGFYIDIGAQDPIVDSVSLAFYEHGWRGVHVEPTQQYSSKLKIARPDETVLQVAIGDQIGTLMFYEFEDTGLSTADSDIAHRHKEAGFHCNETLVSVMSLDSLFKRVGVRDIHWLKLDVEGLEKSVLESWKTSFVFPWVLVVESTRPLTQEENHGEWEHLILNKGYRFVYFDGLNRFYVSPKHDSLASAFALPPNIFDGFVLSGSQPFCKLVDSRAKQAGADAAKAGERATQAETQAQQASERATNAETQAQQADARAAIAEAETRTAQAETRAQQADARAAIAEAETRTAQAETRAQQADARAAIAEAETRTAQAETWAHQAGGRAASAEAHAQQANVRADELTIKLELTVQDLHNVHQANHHHWQLAVARQEQIEALQESTSWCVTAPLRWVSSLARDPTPSTLKRRAKLLLQHAALYVGRRPHLKNAAMNVLRRFPNIKARLAQIIRQATIQPSQHQAAQFHNMHADVTYLTPYTRRIYADMKAAIERRSKGNG